MAKICLDYGHGGVDSGAAYKDRKESEDNLAVGKEVASELRRHGVIVAETRTEDATVSLRDRSNFANKGNYDYFISFHRNAFRPEMARGAETFIHTRYSSSSRELAEKVQASLVEIGFIDRGVKTANFHVLRETTAPSILVEIGFLDNTKDNNLFDSKREEIVKGITKVILNQLGISYVEESALKDAVDLLTEKGIIGSPRYWLENAKGGKEVKGEYAGILIKRTADLLKGL